jgi:hypothetical protein
MTKERRITLTPGMLCALPQKGRLSYIVDSLGESHTYLFRSYHPDGTFSGFLHNVETGDIMYLREGDDWISRYQEAWSPTSVASILFPEW